MKLEEVEIHLSFESYSDCEDSLMIRDVIKQHPDKYWKKGDKIFSKLDGSEVGEYRYAKCSYFKASRYNDLDENLIEFFEIFIPYESDLVKLVQEKNITTLLTIVFKDRSEFLAFSFNTRILKFLCRLEAVIEVT